MTGTTTGETAAQIEYYARALRTRPTSDAFLHLGDQARDVGWWHEEYIAAVLSKEISGREASGTSLRIKAARFPGYRALDNLSFDHQPTADGNLIAHLDTSIFLTEGKMWSSSVRRSAISTPRRIIFNLTVKLGAWVNTVYSRLMPEGAIQHGRGWLGRCQEF